MNSNNLTLEPTPTTLSPARTPRLLAAPRKRILLADDSPQIRESLGKLLRGAGYDVVFAADGGQVLSLALHEEIDLLLLDLNMPYMDGWDALDHLNVMEPSLPIVIITAQPDQREWVKSAGAHALIEKPLDLPLLLETIAELLRESPSPQADLEKGRRERFRYGWPRRHGSGTGRSSTYGGIND